MCGIAGFLQDYPGSGRVIMEQHVQRMVSALSHRGPDGSGHWADPDAGIALGHARLAVLDLSDEGLQPMVSGCGTCTIIYNGEIYNFQELRQQLRQEGVFFHSQTDTEVVLEAIARWGIDIALQKIDGMFAFAVWLRDERKLILARDRIGKKPLYYGWSGGTFYFASELRALRAHPDFEARVDTDAAAAFLRYSYVPSPYSILSGINKLGPGEMLAVHSNSRDAQPRKYWSLLEIAQRGEANPIDMSDDGLVDLLDTELTAAVNRRLVSDVPLGAFLSGGIDSSTVVAMMQRLSGTRVMTFSIGYEDPRFDESRYARAVADHLGTEHHELQVTAQHARDLIPELPRIYDEPFADISQIPTTIVCRLARRDVTVALSGDGGDELFCGYDRYFGALERWEKHTRKPRLVRHLLAGLGTTLRRLMPESHQLMRADNHMRSAGPIPLFAYRSERIPNAESFIRNSHKLATIYTDSSRQGCFKEPLNQMMYLDTLAWLPDDVLVKMDRASMSTGLEVRNPLLDSKVIELAWRLPLTAKLHGKERKHLLKRVLSRYVPRDLTDRRKMGFAVPIGDWLRGPLRDWAESLLDERRIREQGLLEPRAVRRLWAAHLRRSSRHRMSIWNILMLQAWIEQQ